MFKSKVILFFLKADRRAISLCTFALFSLFHSLSAFGFPEMVRHRYVNCTACHVSPSGGGVLNPYGRELSSAVLSSWGSEKEGNFLWNVVSPPSWLDVGGDFRGLELVQKPNHGPSTSQWIFMESDLEAAVHIKRLSLVGSVGLQDPTYYPNNEFISRSHYALYQLTDELAVRAGRFMQAYGINVAEHAIFTKQGLGWDQGTETYNIEGSYLGERYNFYVTGIFSRPDIDPNLREIGVSGSASMMLGETYKLGASYYYGSSNALERNVFGPWGILGFTPHFFLLTEWDFQRNFPYYSANPLWGFVNYQRLDYEIWTGFHTFLTQQFSVSNFADPSTQQVAYGGGIQFFPRPHFEFLLNWERHQLLSSNQATTDWIYLMLHFYP